MSPTPPHPQAELSDSPSSPKRHRTILRSTLAFLGAIFRISFILSSLCVLAASAWTLHALLYPFSLFRRSQRELLKPGARQKRSPARELIYPALGNLSASIDELREAIEDFVFNLAVPILSKCLAAVFFAIHAVSMLEHSKKRGNAGRGKEQTLIRDLKLFVALVSESASSNLGILELCTEDYSLSSAIALSNRYTCLRSASLVSRSWQAPAQSVLWSAVRIYKRTTAQKWLACRVTGVYGTRHLELGGVHSKNEGVSAALAGKIVGRCVGVRELRLCDFGRLSAKVLQSESLAGLRTLVLLTNFPDPPSTLSKLELPFRLRTLRLYNRSYDPTLLTTLFLSSRTSLTTLDLSLNPSARPYPALLSSLSLIAPTLQHLHLNHRPPPALISQLAHCTSLDTLECHSSAPLTDVLDILPHPLRHLTLHLEYNLSEVVTVLAPRLRKPARRGMGGSLERLEVLEVQGCSRRTFWLFKMERWLEEWEAEGVEVRLDEVGEGGVYGLVDRSL